MRRRVLTGLICLLMLTVVSSPYVCKNYESKLSEKDSKSFSSSALTIAFSNGPVTSQTVTGIYQLTFTIGGTGTLNNLSIEIESGGTWTNLALASSITSTSWYYAWDTTSIANGTYNLRVSGRDADVSEMTAITESGSFDVANQQPLITEFTVLNSVVGTGTSSSDRAWFTVEADGYLEFTWAASDDDLSYATLTGVPGPGSPSSDGPGGLDFSWNWSSGAFSESTWSPKLTVYDNSNMQATSFVYIGIDRTGPSIGTPVITGSSNWLDNSEVSFSGLSSGATDNGGSGIDHYEVKDSQSTEWINVGISGSGTIELTEGQRTLNFRAVDLVGNIGPTISTNVNIDLHNPQFLGWELDEITTSLQGTATISFSASDALSGVDISSCQIEYGFDNDGTGTIPDNTGQWLPMPTSATEAGQTMSGQVGPLMWATMAHQYMMIRATVVDNAGNTITTAPYFTEIVPGLDFSWSSANLDRIVLRTGSGDTSNITSYLTSNEAYNGPVTVHLQIAPADRSSTVSWTTLATQTVPSGNFSNPDDLSEELKWNVSLNSDGQWDVRLYIDLDDTIDERDESNNVYYLVISGTDPGLVGVVSGFTPTLFVILFVGLYFSWITRFRTNNSSH